MEKIIKRILELPYYKNCSAQSGNVHNVANHEEAIENILKESDLEKQEIKISIKERDKLLSGGENKNILNNSYILQPCGLHQSPDFIVKKENKLYFLECKSCKTSRPLYNSGIPKEEYIYIFCSEQYNATTVFLGSDLIEPEGVKLIKKHIAQQRENTKKFNEKIKNMSAHGISFYDRPMIIHSKLHSNICIDYFKNENRKRMEENVIKKVSQ